MLKDYHGVTLIGLILVILGFFLILLPVLSKFLPPIERIPSIIWWSYKKNNFYFATSPILILISIASLIFFIFSRYIRG